MSFKTLSPILVFPFTTSSPLLPITSGNRSTSLEGIVDYLSSHMIHTVNDLSVWVDWVGHCIQISNGSYITYATLQLTIQPVQWIQLSDPTSCDSPWVLDRQAERRTSNSLWLQARWTSSSQLTRMALHLSPVSMFLSGPLICLLILITRHIGHSRPGFKPPLPPRPCQPAIQQAQFEPVLAG